jgi:hypothetical protein
MNDLEERLRAAMRWRAAQVELATDPLPAARRRGRRALRARAVLAVGLGITIAVGLIGTPLLVRRAIDRPPVTAGAPSAGPVGGFPKDPRLLQWPTRGPYARDQSQLAAATATWKTGTGGVRLAPHVLWIGPVPAQPDAPAANYALMQAWVPGKGLRLAGAYASAADFRTPPPRAYALTSGSGPITTSTSAVSAMVSQNGGCGGPGRPACGSRAPFTRSLLIVAAPTTTAARYAAPPVTTPGPGPRIHEYRDAGLRGGTALVPLPLYPAERYIGTDGDYDVRLEVYRGRERVHAGSVDIALPRIPVLTAATGNAIEWSPPRGIPRLLDNPETFPGLELWGRTHGLSRRPGYGNPIWGGTLVDGSRALLIQPSERRDIALPAVMHTVFAVNHPPIADTGDTLLVRDRRNPSEPTNVEQISAFLPLRDGRCELVVVGRPGTTAVQYAEGRTGFASLSTTDGVGRLPLATCEGHGAGRIRVLRGTEVAYEGPVDGAGHP